MKLMTKKIKEQLLKNAQATLDAQNKGLNEPDHFPVLKLFNAGGAGTWLITEMDINNNDILFCIADLGLGFVELGSVSLTELQSIKIGWWPCVERDLHFEADKPIGDYLKIGCEKGMIVA